MGTWSHEPFGNDTANNWAYRLERCADFSVVEQAIRAVLDNDESYLDVDLAVKAVAAAEVLARTRGRGTQSDVYTEKVDAWLASIDDAKPSDAIFVAAQQALVLVLGGDSELKQLWEGSADSAEWLSAMQALQMALAD